MATRNNLEQSVAVMANDIEYLKKGVDEIRSTLATLEGRFVTRAEGADYEARLSKFEKTKDGIVKWVFEHIGEIALGALVFYLVTKGGL